jgi:murein DD-endopeptidase MepM/ murein hydrolase activator NlpD
MAGQRRRRRRLAAVTAVLLVLAGCGSAPTPPPTPLLLRQPPPPLPDTTGWGVHVLALARAPDGATWAGSHGAGMFLLPAGDSAWTQLAADGAAGSISWGVVNSIAFGPGRGTVWYGTVGNGFGRSDDNGQSWRNWTFAELGPEWQYVTPGGIVVRRDTVYIATADGLRISGDRGDTWRCIQAADGARGGAAPRDDGCSQHIRALPSSYLLALDVGADGTIWAGHLAGLSTSRDGGRSWTAVDTEGIAGARVRAVRVLPDSGVWAATERAVFAADPRTGTFQQVDIRIPGFTGLPGAPRALVPSPGELPPLIATSYGMIGRTGVGEYRVYYLAAGERYRPAGDIWAGTWWGPPFWPLGGSGAGLARVLAGDLPITGIFATGAAAEPAGPRHAWFGRPVADADGNPYADATYLFGSTMAGRFQAHQGIEFNNPPGTPVRAVGDGVVVFAGPAERDALTVAIRHDRQWDGQHVFSTYYHNSALDVQVGQRVSAGDVVARVGNTGRATNNHLHFEIHVAPTADAAAIVDAAQRFPPHTVNPQLWIEPLPGTGMVAGQVFDAAGAPVPGARVYGLVLGYPEETPFSYAETYADHARGSPAYGEHFAVGDVPAGSYTLGVIIDGQRVWRRVRVAPGQLTWVEFRP